jgi:hypothetical protein
MSGGVIQNNKSGLWGGGGVSVVNGRFSMSGSAEIKKNQTMGSGGGVFLETSNTSFEISGNAKVYGSNAADSNKNTADGGGQALYRGGGIVKINGSLITDPAIDDTIPQ